MGRAPCCDKANVKRGPWSPEEDTVLKTYIMKNGTGGNWITLPQRAGLKRCGKSCRLRWLNYLRPEIRHGGFSAEEDAVICSLYRALGSRWSVIASRLPGRTDNDVKNYWNTKLKKHYSAQQQQHLAAEKTSVSEGNAGHAATVPDSQSPPAAQPCLPPLLPTTHTCSYPCLPPFDHSHFGSAVPSSSPLPTCRPPAFMFGSIDGGYVVTPGSRDDVSSSPPSGTLSSSLTPDYGGTGGDLAFSSTTIDDYVLTTPLNLEDASTTTLSSSMNYGGGWYQPRPKEDESFFGEAEAAFQTSYFSSSLPKLPVWSGATGAYDWKSGVGDSGQIWDVVVDGANS